MRSHRSHHRRRRSSRQKDEQQVQKEQYLQMQVAHLEMSVPTKNRIEMMGIETIRELINKTEEDMLEYEFFGLTYLQEVKEALANIGLSLDE